MSCNKFWLENIKSLFCDNTIIPSHNMTLESRLNAITRLVLGLGIILYLIGYKQSILFILISVLMIILGYYIKTEIYKSKIIVYLKIISHLFLSIH